ncbi:MAG: tyrosine-type recombinase/integrase, partial [Solirubrobacteraceae bacterium]
TATSSSTGNTTSPKNNNASTNHATPTVPSPEQHKSLQEICTQIDMTPWLRAELLRYKLSVGDDPAPSDPVFPTRAGTFRDKDNLNRNVIGPVQRAARKQRAEQGLPALPTRLSAHVFRRTYATFMAEAGAPPRYVQRQLGHRSAKLTLEAYTRVSESQDRRKLGKAFDEFMAATLSETTSPASAGFGPDAALELTPPPFDASVPNPSS